MSMALIYSPPGVRRYKDPCPKLVQVRPRKRVKLATNCKKLRISFKRNLPYGPVLRKIKYLSGTYLRVGSVFMTLKRLLSKYLRFGAAINRLNHTPVGYSRLTHSNEKHYYQRLGSEEHVKFSRRRTITLGNGRMRLGSFRMLRLRLRCFTPVPFLKKLRDAYVKMMINASEKGYLTGLVMSHHWSFPVTTPGSQLHY